MRFFVLLLLLLATLTGTARAATTAQGVSCSSTKACTTTQGGALMVTSRNSCTVGLPVRTRGGQWYLVTAGHCVAEARGATWRQSGTVLGTGTRWEYGGKGTEGARGTSDVGVIKLRKAAKSQVVVVTGGKARTQRITGVANARNGTKVCVTAGRTGRTSCGTVVQETTSLSYPSPGLAARRITNLALVKGICVNPGDSGSPVFTGTRAVGITVAKSGSGCFLWYAKLPAQLTHFGLRVG
jgi:streptogrisin B